MACPVCREQIAAGARKCIKCASDLGWRRFFTFGNTTLALLTALVSVIATAYPAIHVALTPKASDFRVHFVGINAESQTLGTIVSNVGRDLGAIRTLNAVIYLPGNMVVALPSTADRGYIYVEGGKTIGYDESLQGLEVVEHPTIGTPRDVTISLRDEPQTFVQGASGCSVALWVTNSDGTSRIVEDKVVCGDLVYGLRATLLAAHKSTPDSANAKLH